MNLNARALRAIAGVHQTLANAALFCAFPLLALACTSADPGDAGLGNPDQTTAALGGSGPGNAGSAATVAGSTAVGGSSATTTGGTAATTGGSDPATGGTTDVGGAANGGATNGGSAANGGRSMGGNANGGSGGMDPGAGGDDGSDIELDGPVAYGITIAPNGTWMGIEDPAAEIAAIKASGAKYIRFSRADPSPTHVGIPDASNAPLARELIKAGLKLGAVLISQNGLSPAELTQQGKDLRDSGFYDWIFVDGALTRKDIQEVIDGLLSVGWKKIMVNDTLFQTANAVVDPPKRVWGHAKAFGATNNPDGPAVTDYDIKFINWIHTHYPESHALLKLEIDSGIQKFKAMPVATQIRLLTDWKKAQTVNGFTMIFPLFTTTYDSKAEGTYDTQIKLMK